MEVSLPRRSEGYTALLEQVPIDVCTANRPCRGEQDPDEFTLQRKLANRAVEYQDIRATHETTRIVVSECLSVTKRF